MGYRKNVELKKIKVKLSTLQNALQVKGEFKTIVQNWTRDVETNFIVVDGRINSPTLLGESTLIELDMLTLKAYGSWKEKNELRMKEISENHDADD